jgi:malonyl-CoA decarboxylase
MPRLSTFVTLSPAPGFAAWLTRERTIENSAMISADDRARLTLLDQPDWWRDEDTAEALREPLLRAAAAYFLSARTPRGRPVDPVARFHLGNGARLEQLDWLADVSPRGLAQSHGLMVNYLYDLDHIERNHEAYAANRTIVASNQVRRLARHAPLQLIPAAAG